LQIKIKKDRTEEVKCFPGKYYEVMGYYFNPKLNFKEKWVYLVENEIGDLVSINEDLCFKVIEKEQVAG